MKINTFLGFLKLVLRGTFIYCPFCHNLFVSSGKAEVTEQAGMQRETYPLTCGMCGKTGTVTEIWDL